MGVLTGFNQNIFKPADLIYSKIKREFKGYVDANLIDENDFPQYIAETLNRLGVGALKEEEAILTVKNKKTTLPKDFKQLYAAYKCSCSSVDYGGRHFQHKSVIENDITCEVLGRTNNCKVHCECPDKIIERVTVKQYVNEGCIERQFKDFTLLKLSPNVKPVCSEDCLNLLQTCQDEISINNGHIFTNFCDGDIYLKYYAFPMDENGMPLIPNIVQIEKACEAYIRYQLFQLFWLTGDVSDAAQKTSYLQAEYEKAFAEATYYLKTPSFQQMINTIRTKRSGSMINIISNNLIR